MQSRSINFLLLLAAVAAPSIALAQSTAAAAPSISVAQSTKIDNATAEATIEKEFGVGYKLAPKQPILVGDFDADGEEDVVFVVTGKNPLTDEAGHNYKVIDPYNSYFGYGNPKVTYGFVSMSAEEQRLLMVIHSWKAPTPKAKFVIINLPFEKISTGSFRLKKKSVSAITAEEPGGVASAVFWDGKKYKWEAYGSN